MRRALPLLFLLVLAACGGQGAAGPGATAEPPETAAETETATGTDTETGATATEPATTSVVVYFLRGETVFPVRRAVPETEAVAAAAVAALLEGPTGVERGYGLSSSVPPGTELLGIDVDAGTATVDLSRAFEEGGGTLSMTTRLAQLVFTLTRFPTVERVALRLDGDEVEAIGGEGVLVRPPRTRGDFPDATPPILVEEPLLGDVITSPVRVAGTASVFEANVVVRVLDAEGEVLAEDFTTAAEGAPGRGPFELELPFDAEEAGPGAVVAVSPSAAGGPPQHAFEVAVELSP